MTEVESRVSALVDISAEKAIARVSGRIASTPVRAGGICASGESVALIVAGLALIDVRTISTIAIISWWT